MLKKLGLPMIVLAGMLTLGSPKPADAKVHFGVTLGAPAYPYAYCSPYDPYCSPYVYPYNYGYGYSYPYVYGGWGGHGHHERHEFRGHRR